MTGRWWEATSADVIRVERETPTTEELGRRAGEAIVADPRQKAYVEGLVQGMIDKWRRERDEKKPRS